MRKRNRVPIWRSLGFIALLWSMASPSNMAFAAPALQEAPPSGWSNYTTVSEIEALVVDEDKREVWAGTHGGVLRWDLARETYSVFTTADGLPSNLVFSALRDEAGKLYFGTRNGLAERTPEGVWTQQLDAAGAAIGVVHDIAIDGDGGLWLGTWAGLLHRNPNGSWRRYDGSTGLPGDTIYALTTDSDGRVWAAVWDGPEGRGLATLSLNGGWNFVRQAEGLASDRVNDLEVDGMGRLVVGTDAGVSRRGLRGQWQHFGMAQGLPGQEVLRLAAVRDPVAPSPEWKQEGGTGMETGQDRDASSETYSLWIATRDGLARLDEQDQIQSIRAADGQSLSWLSAMAGDRQGRLYAGAEGILAREPNGDWNTWKVPSVIRESHIDHAVLDAAGHRFFASRHGIARLTPEGIWSYEGTEALPASGEIGSLTVGREGRALLTIGGTVLRDLGLDTGWTALPLAADVSIWKVLQLLEAKDGRLFAGVWTFDEPGQTVAPAGLLIREADGSWQRIDASDGLAGDSVQALASGAENTLWIGGDTGLARRSPDGNISLEPSLAGHSVTALLGEGESLWIATDHGLFWRSATGEYRSWSVGEGAPSGALQALALDASGGLWIATEEGGAAYRSKDGDMRYFGIEDGLLDSDITDVMIDTEGSVWLTSLAGINRRASTGGRACDRAVELKGENGVGIQLADVDDAQYVAFDLEQAFSRVEIGITDPDNRLEVFLFRSCRSAGTPSGRHIGTPSGRHIGGEQRLTFDAGSSTGRYVALIRAREGIEAEVFPLEVQVRLSVRPIDPEASRLLVLTHEPRMRSLWSDESEVDDLMASLESLVAEEGGVLVRNLQTDTDEATRAAYAAWLADPTSLARANAVASTLGAWIDERRDYDLPRLRYVLLVGDDRLIPHQRVAVLPESSDAQWVTEDDYLAGSGIDPASSVGSALAAADFVLSDAAYAAPLPIAWGPGGRSRLPLPRLAVGRLVESPAAMRGLVESHRKGAEIQIGRSLNAGWDFMADATRQGDAILAAAGLGDPQRGLLAGEGWTRDALLALLDARPELVFLAAHADHEGYALPDRNRITAEDIAQLPAPKGGRLVYSLACHGGLSVPGGEHARPLDLPEAWLGSGSHLIGSSGWAYGLPHLLGYQEALMVELTQALADGAGEGIALGDALLEARVRYLDSYRLDAYHAKTLAGTLLYGLPMSRVKLRQPDDGGLHALMPPGRRSERAGLDRDPAQSSEASDATKPTIEIGPGRMRRSAGANLVLSHDQGSGDRPSIERRIKISTSGLRQVETEDGEYYSFGDRRPEASNGAVVQPLLQTVLAEQRLDGRTLDVRGAWLREARYQVVPGFAPLVARAGILGADQDLASEAALTQTQLRRAHQARLDASEALSGLHPPLLFDLQPLLDESASPFILQGGQVARLDLRLGQYDADTGAERLLTEVVIEEFYGEGDDRSAPAILEVDASGSDEDGMLRVRTGPAGPGETIGATRVALACDDGQGSWYAVDMQPIEGEAEVWSAEPRNPAHACLVQAADAEGNSAFDSNAGKLYRSGASGGDGYTLWLPRVGVERR